jgi:hypothetical protein
MADSEDEQAVGAPVGAEEDARVGLVDVDTDEDDERDEVVSITATIVDGDMSADDADDGSDDDEPETEECPWSYLDLRRDFYAEVRKMKWPHPRLLDPCPPRSLPA